MRLSGYQIDVLNYMRGDEDEVIRVHLADGFRGIGLYAYWEDYPDEGSVFLGKEEGAVL